VEASVPPFDTSLVDFENPPVVEVALGIQFEEPVTSDGRTLGRFWPTVREDYPRLEQQPGLPPQSEEFGPPAPPSFEFLTGPPPARHWLLNEPGDWLIQLQPDRIMLNWRRVSEGHEYPRYEALRPLLRTHLDTLLGLPDGPNADQAKPDWVDVTYVNQVVSGSASEYPSLSSILTLISDSPDSLPPIEHSTFTQQHVVRNGDEPVGRLHITAQPGIRNADRKPLYTITLVARLKVSEPTLDGAFTALDGGRALVVETFRDITEPSMHAEWGIEG